MKRSYLLIIICLILFSTNLILSGQRRTASIRNFSLGLNTTDDVTKLRLGEAEVCHNWDLSKSTNRLVIRDGYDSIFKIPGIDSFLWNGLMTYKQVDGNKRLLFIGDSTGVGYSNIYASELNSFKYSALDSFFTYPSAVDSTVDTAGGTVASIDTFFDTTSCWDCNFIYNGLCYNPIYQGHPEFDSCWTVLFDADSVDLSFSIDSIIDTTFSDSVITVTYLDTFTVEITIGSFVCADTFIADIEYTLNDICDSMAVRINASCGDSVTASVDVDTLIIAEDINDLDAVLTLTNFTLNRVGGEADGTGRIGTFFPSTGEVKHVQYRENMYIVNGVGKGVRFDGNQIHKFPFPASGEMNVIPLNISGELNGDYRYALLLVPKANSNDTIYAPADTGRLLSYTTTPVKVDSGQVRLSFFPIPAYGMDFPADTTFTLEIWRTTGDIGAIDKSDTIWFTGWTIDVDSSDFYNEIDTFIIDTISDDSLRNSTRFTNMVYSEILNLRLDSTNDSTTNGGGVTVTDHKLQYYNRIGAPSLIGFSSANGNLGVWEGLDTGSGGAGDPMWRVAAGWSYLLVSIDTLNNTPADTGVTLNLYQDAKPIRYDTSLVIPLTGTDTSIWTNFQRDSTEKLVIRLPYNSQNIKYQLYRGSVVPISYDSIEIPITTEGFISRMHRAWEGFTPPHIGREFAVFDYYLIGEFSPGDSVIDSMSYTDLLGQIPLARNAVPKMPNFITSFDSRLMLADEDGWVYISDRSDTAVTFDIFSKVGVNRYDGDFITTIFPQKNAMRVLKNKSSYNIRKLTNGFWGAVGLQDNYGSVSSLSHASSPEGNYYLSGDGIRLESENVYKDFSYPAGLITRKVKWFREATILTLSKNYSTYYDNKYICSFPGTDTSYIVFKVAGERGFTYPVGTWGFTMAGSALFSTTSKIEKRPDDSLYFFKAGGSSLYRYGSTASDNGFPVIAEWRSGGLLPMSNMYVEPIGISLLIDSDDTSSVGITSGLAKDKENNPLVVYFPGSTRIDFERIDTSYVHSFDYAPISEAFVWRIWLQTATIQEFNTEILGIDIDFIDRGFSIRK